MLRMPAAAAISCGGLGLQESGESRIGADTGFERGTGGTTLAATSARTVPMLITFGFLGVEQATRVAVLMFAVGRSVVLMFVVWEPWLFGWRPGIATPGLRLLLAGNLWAHLHVVLVLISTSAVG